MIAVNLGNPDRSQVSDNLLMALSVEIKKVL
jgi:hypothetical protein